MLEWSFERPVLKQKCRCHNEVSPPTCETLIYAISDKKFLKYKCKTK